MCAGLTAADGLFRRYVGPPGRRGHTAVVWEGSFRTAFSSRVCVLVTPYGGGEGVEFEWTSRHDNALAVRRGVFFTLFELLQ